MQLSFPEVKRRFGKPPRTQRAFRRGAFKNYETRSQKADDTFRPFPYSFAGERFFISVAFDAHEMQNQTDVSSDNRSQEIQSGTYLGCLNPSLQRFFPL